METLRAPFPPEVAFELPGWELFWAELEPTGAEAVELALLRHAVTARVRQRFRLETLPEEPAVAGLRKLFRRAGCEPTRHRSGSEALLRRILKGEEMPAVSPLVDLGNCVAAELATNVCVMDADAVTPPFVLRAGREGEEMLSLRGPFDCEGKPVLFDAVGPADVPITGAERSRVTEATRRAWLIVYAAEDVFPAGKVEETLRRFLADAPVARLIAFSGAASASPSTRSS